jgi:hypothetical protein
VCDDVIDFVLGHAVSRTRYFPPSRFRVAEQSREEKKEEWVEEKRLHGGVG